mgnify:CR=1 FL=1|jgi:nitronate monooxygenase
MKTRVTEILGIKYPIMQGGMQWLTGAEFAASVCNAGALGTINASVFDKVEDLRLEIRKLKNMTDRPFAVNISMLPETTENELTDDYFQAVFEEKVKIIETAGRNPEKYIPDIKKHGVKLIHKVPAVRFARKAQEIGADIVTIVGYECAGHPGMDDVASSVLIQKATGVLDIPVMVGGGIVDGRGLVAALAWGAEGVVMGTRFIATKECPINTKFKEWIIQAKETDTILIQRSIKNTLRVMKNKAALKVLEMEKKGATLEELMPFISGKVGKKALAEGNLERANFAIGQGIGLIREIKTVQEVIEDTIKGAEETLLRLNTIVG